MRPEPPAPPADLEGLALSLLDHARRAGADAADAMASSEASVSVDVRGGGLEQAERAEGLEIGLRVLVGQRQACVAAADLRPETLSRMAERAVEMARAAPIDESIGLADPSQLATDLDAARLELADPAPEPDPARLQAQALEAEAAARAVAGVTQVDAASASYGRRAVWVAATNGFAAGWTRTSAALACVAIAGEGAGMERDYCTEMRVFRADLPSPEEIGRIAGERAVSRTGPRRPPTGAFPVLYDERTSASLIGHLVQAANGSMVARGSTWLRDALGEAVLPAGLSLVEDPHRKRAGGSRLFDVEGLPARRRALVEDGVLAGWTLDLATGRKLGLESTGNASRSPASPPSPSVGNLDLTPGEGNRAALMREMGRGLLVTSLIGSSVNPTTGDYSRGAGGFWVEDGQLAHPVNECTIAGNLREVLRTIRPANDAPPHRSRRIPSLLVEGLTVAGG